MAEQINLDTAADEVRQFFLGLGRLREPVELLSGGVVVARLTSVAALSDEEQQRIAAKGWEVVQEARANARGMPTSKIQKVVDQAVREVRARAVKRRSPLGHFRCL